MSLSEHEVWMWRRCSKPPSVRAHPGWNKEATAMEINSFRDMYIAELQELVSVENQLSDALLHGANPSAHTDQTMQALVTETKKMLTMLMDDDLRDAGLIASVQKLEHYEIAAYGTAAALAGQLDLRDEQKMLHLSLEEEKRTDALLTQLAKREVNPHALAA